MVGEEGLGFADGSYRPQRFLHLSTLHNLHIKVLTMNMARYIMQILRTQLMVMFSWGFHSAYAIHDGLAFFVNGYLHKGKVEVVYDEGTDTFTVRTINRDGSVKQQEEGVYLDCLVSVIDTMVERCPDYANRVEKTYGISSK